MAIKVTSTTVIDNTRKFDVTGVSGRYDDLRAQLHTVSGTVLDFNYPVLNKVMTANTSFTESNKGAGKASILILDTGTAGYTPTFSGNVEWANDTTPTWSSNRYWHIGLTCWNTTTVRAVASGYGSTGGSPSETISLSGTSSSPNFYLGEAAIPNSVSAGIKTKSDGTIWGSLNATDDLQFNAGTEWCNVAPASPGSYYIRCTVHSGTLDAFASDNTGTWEPMNNAYNWCCTATNSDRGPKFVTLKLEISTTSNGSNIVATGYYQASAWVTP